MFSSQHIAKISVTETQTESNFTYFCLLPYIITSTSDLQPSTAIVSQLPGHLVSTEIRIIGLNCFNFIMESIVPSTKIVQITE